MQKKLNRLIAMVLTFTLVGVNFITTSVYAADDIQSLATSQANVQFNAKIGDSYNTTADITNGTKLNLTLNVLNTGYLKDIEVSTDGNNYLLSDVTDKSVKSVSDNKVELNTINAGESINVAIPASINKSDRISTEDFSKDSTVTLKATYVNAKGSEENVTKTVKEHLTWVTSSEYTISQNLIRYIKYADGKTMIGFEITDGIKENKIPFLTKELSLASPKLGNNIATSVNVTGDNISYSYQNGIVTIKQENAKDSNNKIAWNSESKYIVTYLYDNQVDSQEITSAISGKATTVDSKTLTTAVENKYTINNIIGNIIDGSITGNDEISKGYMYSNLNKQSGKIETAYSIGYVANVALADLTDSIKILESTTNVTTTSNEIINFTGNIINKKVSVSASDLIKILGNDGTIKIKLSDGTEIGTLSKDKTELEINKSEQLIIETSKTVSAGNLTIQVSKAIDANISYTKDLIKSLSKLECNAQVTGLKDTKVVSNENVSKLINLKEPTSNATINVSPRNLSTVVENKDVVITATLNTNSVEDALYQNPKMTITLPEEVKSINLTDARILYEDELTKGNLTTTGNKIQIDLNGTQTKYSSQSVSDGTVIRIVANLVLDNLATSRLTTASLTYSNEANGETKTTTTNVNIIAQTGFITTSTLTVDENTISAQETENVTKVKTAQESKEMTITGTVGNNIGTDAEGFIILGRIPYTGNKTAEGNDLSSNINTIMASEVKVTGADFTIYYSDNINEDVNSTVWNTKYTTNSKSFKLVANSKLASGTKVTFNYKVTLPANLIYGMTSKATYAIYYNNNSTEGTKQNIIVTKAIGVTTGENPVISATVSAINTKTGETIANGANVQEGDYITYRVTVKNTGKEDATNVKVKANLPEGMGIVNYEFKEMVDSIGRYIIDYKNKSLEKTIGTIKAESEQTVEFTLAVTQVISEINIEKTEGQTEEQIAEQIAQAEKLKVDFISSADNLENQGYSFTVKNTKGFLSASLTSDVKSNNNVVEKDQYIYYRVSIDNANEVEKTGIIVKLQLPKGIEYAGTEYASSYDKTSNIVTANIDKIAAFSSYSIAFTTKVTSDNATLSTYATVACEQTSNLAKTNTITYTVGTAESSTQIIATQTSNVSETILDTDSLEFYIDIKNNQSVEAFLKLTDTLPTGLKVKHYELTIDGNKVQSTDGGYILTSFSLPAGKSAKAIIIANIYPIEKGTTATFENAPTLKTTSGTNININSIKVTIKGTGNTGTNSNTNNNNEEPSKDGTYKIAGTAWIDTNYDGKKDDTEQRISGLTTKLYNKSTGKLATDADGKEVASTTTSDEGKYSFTNLKNGDYIVLIEYDISKYDITTYQAKDLVSAENSDFVSAKANNADVAATNTITISNANIYNLDLGLTDKKKFDLSINQLISKMTITNTKAKTHIYSYNKSIAKVELSTRYIEYATVLVEYTIKVTNDGKVAGYAKSIVDYLPTGMTFNSELNSNWYIGEDGNAYNTSLANTIINPGETKELTLVLSKKMTADNTGTFRNTAEIKTSYNEYGIEDSDSTPGNKQDGEDDISSTDAIILIGTGKETASIIGITLGSLSIIALAAYEIKKHVINKMYRNIL